MMIGEQRNHSNPTVHVPPWPFSSDDPTATDHYYNNLNSPVDDITLLSLQRFLPSNTLNNDPEDGFDFPVDNFSSDQFRIYEFKVRKCTHGRSHDWTECPFAHPGEKARRRDPRKFHYSGTACPEYRKGGCRKGDSCEFAHGVFECWLHPGRYRTQPCKDGLNCRRRVCFFAHAPDQLRVLSPRGGNTNPGSNTEVFETGGLYSPHRLGNTNPGSNTEVFETGMYSPHRLAFEGNKNFNFVSSPESNSPPTESPPMSPISPMRVNQVQSLSRSLGSGSGHGFGSGSGSISEMVASLRQLQLNKINSSWGLEPGFSPPGLGSGRVQMIRPEFCSLPNTPTRVMTRPGIGYFDAFEEEPVMERVESGRGLRARMFEKLSKENSLDSSGSGQDPNLYEAPNPDVGWVTDLLQ